MPYYRRLKLLLGSALILLTTHSFTIESTGKLTVVVNNIDKPSGEVRVAIYNSENTFWTQKNLLQLSRWR